MPNQGKRHQIKLKTSRVNLLTNLILPPLKLTVGVMGRSVALIADAVNSIADVVSYSVMYFFMKLAGRPRDEGHDYGHGKYETIATFSLSVMMIVAAALIIVQSVQTFYYYFRDDLLPEVPDWSVVGVALFTIALKIVLYLYTKRQAELTRSEGLMAQALDHKSDVFTSLAVLIGAGGAILLSGMGLLLEPLAAFIVAIGIMRMGISILHPSFQKLTDGSLPTEDEENILDIVSKVPGVHNPHNMKSRMIGSSRVAIELDICVDGEMSVDKAHDIADNVEKRVRAEYGPDTHIIIHLEPVGRVCYDAN